MEEKQYAGLSTLQSIVNCCKKLFATHRRVDDLAEDVAYINTEDDETITDALPAGGVIITDDGNGNVTITSTNTLPEWDGGNY